MTRPLRAAVAALLLPALVGLASCAGGDQAGTATTTVPGRGNVRPVVWADRTCAGFNRWMASLDEQSALAAASMTRTDAVGARLTVIRLFDQGVASTAVYLRALARGGDPAVAHGVDVTDALVRRVRMVDRAMRRARADARTLSVDDPARLQLTIGDLVNTYERRVSAASRTFDGLDRMITDPTLRRAFQEACGS